MRLRARSRERRRSRFAVEVRVGLGWVGGTRGVGEVISSVCEGDVGMSFGVDWFSLCVSSSPSSDPSSTLNKVLL